MQYKVRTALWAGFGLVIGLFLAATVVTVSSVARVRVLEEHLAFLDHAKHQGHLTLADIQEQYIHQAHTLILGNLSHLDQYNEARQAVLDRLEHLEECCEHVGFVEEAQQIRGTADEMDRYFTEVVLDGIAQGRKAPQGSYHERLEELTDRAQVQVLHLNSLLEDQSADAREELVEVLARTQAGSMATLSLGLAVALVVGFILVRVIGRPITRLHEALGRLGGGDLETRVAPEGPYELRELAGTFNRMADALVGMKEQIAQHERMAVMGELAAGVAHELNNPLGVITGYLKVVRKGCDDEQTSGDLDIISDEVKNCQEIVQGLLELARPRELDRRPVDLVSMIRDVVGRLEIGRPDPRASIHLDHRVGSAIAYVDEAGMRRVVTNLLTNALDAAGKDGRVDVVVDQSDGEVWVAVSNTGEGISPEIKGDLFKPFKTTKAKGTGLGLAISETIVRSHGGRIEGGDRPVGGALFRVVLPTGELPSGTAQERQ